jgi:hypothetical protein
VARIAGRWRIGIAIVDMALRAGQRSVHAGKRIIGKQRVIEARIQPAARRVACTAIVRQPELHMRWVVATGEIGLMARIAISGRARKDVVDVTCGAWERRVHSRKCITGILQMVELGVQP